jgi:hypothetical protein
MLQIPHSMWKMYSSKQKTFVQLAVKTRENAMVSWGYKLLLMRQHSQERPSEWPSLFWQANE